MTGILFVSLEKSAWSGLFCLRGKTLGFSFFDVSLKVSNGIGHFIRDEFIDIAERFDVSCTWLLFLLIPKVFVHLQISAIFLFFLS